MISNIIVKTQSQGLLEITDQIAALVHKANPQDGLCVVFIQHTSASLIIQENADPTAKRDLEYWLNKLVAENDPGFQHTYEGPDDMPSHIKAALTNTSLAIPVQQGRLVLGTWQGIYLWEHRKTAHTRKLVVYIS